MFAWKMNAKISNVLYMRRKSAGSAIVPEVIEAQAGGYATTVPTVPTMADSVRPLLTSMKLFGLYFKRETEAGDKFTDGKWCRRWNGYMIYSLVVVILHWIDVARMFSVFKSHASMIFTCLITFRYVRLT